MTRLVDEPVGLMPTAGVGDTTAARVLLLGLMGVGKSTVGTALHELTDWTYLDNDALVAKATGRPTPDVLTDSGVDSLRAAESAALRQAFNEAVPVIAGVAAGVVTQPGDLALLRQGDAFVVWLTADIETLISRVGSGEGRPWLQPNPATAMRRLAAGRDPLYASVADLTLATDTITAQECAEQIVAAVTTRGSSAG